MKYNGWITFSKLWMVSAHSTASWILTWYSFHTISSGKEAIKEIHVIQFWPFYGPDLVGHKFKHKGTVRANNAENVQKFQWNKNLQFESYNNYSPSELESLWSRTYQTATPPQRWMYRARAGGEREIYLLESVESETNPNNNGHPTTEAPQRDTHHSQITPVLSVPIYVGNGGRCSRKVRCCA